VPWGEREARRSDRAFRRRGRGRANEAGSGSRAVKPQGRHDCDARRPRVARRDLRPGRAQAHRHGRIRFGRHGRHRRSVRGAAHDQSRAAERRLSARLAPGPRLRTIRSCHLDDLRRTVDRTPIVRRLPVDRIRCRSGQRLRWTLDRGRRRGKLRRIHHQRSLDSFRTPAHGGEPGGLRGIRAPPPGRLSRTAPPPCAPARRQTCPGPTRAGCPSC